MSPLLRDINCNITSTKHKRLRIASHINFDQSAYIEL